MRDKQVYADCPWDGAQSTLYPSSTHPYIMKVNVEKAAPLCHQEFEVVTCRDSLWLSGRTSARHAEGSRFYPLYLQIKWSDGYVKDLYLRLKGAIATWSRQYRAIISQIQVFIAASYPFSVAPYIMKVRNEELVPLCHLEPGVDTWRYPQFVSSTPPPSGAVHILSRILLL